MIPSNSSEIEVSICVITFNHENFIEETLRGICAQIINFNSEIIIFDDCSTDETVSKANNFLRHNSQFEFYLHVNKVNQGFYKNFISMLSKARGRFIALCDGDDYWIDEFKLSRQHELMTKNNELIGTFSNAKILTDKKISLFNESSESNLVSMESIIKIRGGLFPTSTLFYRNIKLKELNFPILAGDSHLILALSQNGKIHFDHRVTGVYRKHKNGAYTEIMMNRSKILKNEYSNIYLLDYHRKTYEVGFKNIFDQELTKIYRRIFRNHGISGLLGLPFLKEFQFIFFCILLKINIRNICRTVF